jgi:hypothetical protein
MSADATYPNGFQIRQGGNAVVPTGKTLDIESGGALTSGGTTMLNGAGAFTPTTITASGVITPTGGIAAAGGYTLRPYNIRTWQPVAATSGTDTACSNGTGYTASWGSTYSNSRVTHKSDTLIIISVKWGCKHAWGEQDYYFIPDSKGNWKRTTKTGARAQL